MTGSRHPPKHTALAALPAWRAEVERATGRERVAMIARGALAGNLFDMGSAATVEAFATSSPAFGAALARVPARPWHVDDLDRAAAWLEGLTAQTGGQREPTSLSPQPSRSVTTQVQRLWPWLALLALLLLPLDAFLRRPGRVI